jgi:hypothetical protein
MAALMRSLLAILEHQGDESCRLMRAVESTQDPEILMFFARHYSRSGFTDSATAALKQAVQAGFVCPPETLKSDQWLRPLHGHPEFSSILRESHTLLKQARAEFMVHIGQPGMWEI